MPPRFAYWTILIDQKPTAFRAAEKEDLLPTLVQLQRKNPDVVLKWFARGKLWDTPEQATWARTNLDRPGEKRNRDWRPGGKHEDPRARFKKGGRRDSPRAAFAKKASAYAKTSPYAKPATDKQWDKPADKPRDSDAPRPLPPAARPSAYAKPKWSGDRKPSGERPKWSGERDRQRPAPGAQRPKWSGERKPPPSGDRPSAYAKASAYGKPGVDRPAGKPSEAPRPLPSKPLPASARPKWTGGDKPRSDRRPPPRGDSKRPPPDARRPPRNRR